MSQLKAFAVYGAQIDNTRSVVAPLGEISTLSLTQTREHTIHRSSSYPETTLVGFVYRNNTGGVEQTPTPIANLAVMAVDWVYTQMRTGGFTNDPAAFRTKFNAQFSSVFDLGQVGVMVEQDANFAPAFITIAPSATGHVNEWRIWLADAYFLSQFDVFEHNSVPPIVSIDRFFEPYAAVKTFLEELDPIELQERTNAVRGINPETITRMDRFDWVDPSNATRRIPTFWNSVIYGNAGNNFDQVKVGHRKHILANSEHTADEWAIIFPSLFASAELIITPIWYRYALENMERDTGIWSGIVPPNEALVVATASAKGPGYTSTHVAERYEIFPTHFRGVMCCSIPGPDNNLTMRTFSAMYPDYANVPTGDIDFGKISAITQQFILKLGEMLEHAEVMTETSSVPQGYSRLVRDGIVYLAVGYGDYTLLVTTKFSVDIIAEAL